MNNKQRLRYIVNMYGNQLEILDLYSLLKEKVWKIKKSSELSEDKIKQLTETYDLGIKGVRSGLIDKIEAKAHMLKQII